ncbi:MAG: hypothetical protein JWN18_159 [Parcubacteria group bacterium]|nr:hypothetical protein [Parcubacteria group bacterium]
MDPELKKLLEENLVLAKDNNRMLHNIRRNQVLSTVWTVLVWVVALAIPVYLYQHFVQPVVHNFFSPTATSTPSVFVFPASAEVQKLINSYKVQK